MIESGLTDENVKKFANLLFGVAFFNIFSMDELIAIVKEARLMKWKSFSRDKQIFAEGVFDQHFYIVLKGKIEIRKKTSNSREKRAGEINTGDVFGELVVTDPSKPRRASAYVSSSGPAVLCEIDATLIDTVTPQLRAKFLKKFFDLILDRIDVDARKLFYYQDIIEYARGTGVLCNDDFFSYSLETAVSDKHKITQLIKYTDFIVARKMKPENSEIILRNHLKAANRELDELFHST